MKKSYENNNKRSYSILDIQGYFKYIIKKQSKKINDNNKPLRRIFVNKIKNRITFKIKTGYYIELVTPETMKLLGSSKSKITKDENGKNAHVLEINELD